MMVTQSIPSIILGPTGNLQGMYKFFSLKQQKMMAYPMPASIIKKVEQLGKANVIPNAFDFGYEWSPVQVEQQRRQVPGGDH